jgi:hypothetical protein
MRPASFAGEEGPQIAVRTKTAFRGPPVVTGADYPAGLSVSKFACRTEHEQRKQSRAEQPAYCERHEVHRLAGGPALPRGAPGLGSAHGSTTLLRVPAIAPASRQATMRVRRVAVGAARCWASRVTRAAPLRPCGRRGWCGGRRAGNQPALFVPGAVGKPSNADTDPSRRSSILRLTPPSGLAQTQDRLQMECVRLDLARAGGGESRPI